jgi:uncharacterized protein
LETTKYVIILTMNQGRSFTEELIKEHVAFLRDLDQKGKLELCGPFTDYAGGMIVVRADSYEEAVKIAKSDPFISSGTESFEVRTWQLANKENNYLL